MTRKDFELIAAVFDEVYRRLGPEPDGDLDFMHAVLADSMAAALRMTNPAFNSARFLRACGR